MSVKWSRCSQSKRVGSDRKRSVVGQFPYVHLVGIETVNRLVPPPHIEQLRPQSHNSRPHAPVFPGGHLAAPAPLGKCSVHSNKSTASKVYSITNVKTVF